MFMVHFTWCWVHTFNLYLLPSFDDDSGVGSVLDKTSLEGVAVSAVIMESVLASGVGSTVELISVKKKVR